LPLPFTACLAAVASAAAIWAAIPWLKQRGAVACENSRTMHRGSVPKGGGGPLLAAAGLAVVISPLSPASPPWAYLGLGALVLAALSWRDDLGHLPAYVRLPVHLATAMLLVSGLQPEIAIFQGFLPHWADRAATVIVLAWMVNLYNFMDGINGMAGAETISISLGYLLIGSAGGLALAYAPLAAALLGASAGFLVWNAREKPLVFLGDVGSVPLGFLMGALMLDLAQRGLWAAALILPAYYLADATLTLFSRLLRGERLWEAHKSHAYQRAAEAVGKHLPIVGRVVLVNALLIGAAIMSVRLPVPALALAFLVVAILLVSLAVTARTRSLGSDPSPR